MAKPKTKSAAKKLVKKPAKQPAKKPVKKSAKKSAKKPVKQPAKKPVKKPAKKPVKKSAKKSAKPKRARLSSLALISVRRFPRQGALVAFERTTDDHVLVAEFFGDGQNSEQNFYHVPIDATALLEPLSESVLAIGPGRHANGRLAIPARDGIRVFDVDGTAPRSLALDDGVADCSPDPMSDRVFAVTDTGDLVSWPGEHKRALGQQLLGLDISPDGRTVVASGFQSTFLVDADTLEVRATLDGGGYRPRFSPDGAHVGVGAADGTLHVWDVASTKRLLEHSLGTGEVFPVVFNRDGTLLAAGGRGVLAVIDLATMQPFAQLDLATLPRHDEDDREEEDEDDMWLDEIDPNTVAGVVWRGQHVLVATADGSLRELALP